MRSLVICATFVPLKELALKPAHFSPVTQLLYTLSLPAKMAQAIEKIKETLTDNKKIRDLSKDTYDPATLGGMTSDHGTAILNTDTW